MTVHTQRVEVHRPQLAAPSQQILVYLAIAIALALLIVGALVLAQVIQPVSHPNWVMIEKLGELRTSIGGGGFI